jgi:hypothetical protein
MRESLITYADGTKSVCFYIIFSILLIFLFIISPLKQYVLTSLFGKIVVLFLLGYALYKNMKITNEFSKNASFTGQWNDMKTNILCSYVFSLFIIILILSLVRRLM